jgi:hypothetical protein
MSKENKNLKIKQLNFKVSSDFYWKLKNFATLKRCKMSEVLEKAFEFYQKREKIIQEINAYRQTIPAIEQQTQFLQGNMSWSELERRMKNLTPVYFNKIGLTNTYQVVKESLSECLRLEKERQSFN